MSVPSLPQVAVEDNFYVCMHHPDSRPSFYLHDFGTMDASSFKPITGIGGFPAQGQHYAITHTHAPFSQIAQAIDHLSKHTLFDLIARVNWDIAYHKSVLRSFSHLNLQDLNGNDAKKVSIITKEIAEDQALLSFLEGFKG